MHNTDKILIVNDLVNAETVLLRATKRLTDAGMVCNAKALSDMAVTVRALSQAPFLTPLPRLEWERTDKGGYDAVYTSGEYTIKQMDATAMGRLTGAAAVPAGYAVFKGETHIGTGRGFRKARQIANKDQQATS